MKKLEAIVWPHTKNAVLNQIEAIRSETSDNKTISRYPIIVVEAAMLLDADWNEFLDGLWIVTTSTDNALQRLMETRNLTQEEAQKRIDAQQARRGVGNLLDEVERGFVSAVIENNGDLHELQQALTSKLKDANSWYKR
jgi:dephospho-CoA kinase